MLSERSTATRAAPLWIGFVFVHLWLCFWNFKGPHIPLNDVTTVYHDWIFAGEHGLGWVGLQHVWVYPTVALLPMLAAAAFGFANYSVVWLALVVLLDAAALALLTRAGTRFVRIGWWWLLFLMLLGPISLGRIDSITVPLALAGLIVVARRPVVAGILVTVAIWIKVWPAAILLAVLVASKRRIEVAAGAIGSSIVIVLVALLVGGRWSVITGFVGQQTGRGLQIEAPVTSYWLWLEALHVPGVMTKFDFALVTWQMKGPGVLAASKAMTPIMIAVFLGLTVLGIWATRRGAEALHVLAPLSLAVTTAFIVTNKVGSPQYEAWLAVPVILGLVLARQGSESFRTPAAMVLAIAVLTQVVYPWGYEALIEALPWMVVLITLRNALLVGLLVVATVRIVRVGREARSSATTLDHSRSASVSSRGADARARVE